MNDILLRFGAALILFFTMLASLAPTLAQECAFSAKEIELDGVTLHYVECGEGEPVVLVHGSTGDLGSLQKHAQLLSSEFKVVAYSRRYHFPNDPPEDGDEYALQTHADDLARLIEGLELAPAHIIGHSYGGYVSLVFALQHPEKVRSLVLGEPPVLPLLSRTAVGKAQRESFDQRVVQYSREAYAQGDMKGGISRFLDGVIYPGWFENLPEDAQNERVVKAGPEHRLELLTDASVYMPPVACSDLARLTTPTLLMTGENSDVRFLLITAELEDCLEGESHVMVPGVGHGLFSNVPFSNQAILDFLDSQ